MKLRKSHKTRGVSVTELAIVLGVVGVVLGGVWAASRSVRQTAKVEQSVEAIGQIVEGVRAAYAARPQIGGLMNGISANGIAWIVPNLTAVQAFPSHLLNNAPTTLATACAGSVGTYFGVSPWGGKAADNCGTLRVCNWPNGVNWPANVLCVPGAVPVAAAPATAAQYVAVEFTLLDQAGCINLAMKPQLSSPVSGLADVYINGCSAFGGRTGAACAGLLPAAAGVPVKSAYANARCTGAANYTVDFIYTLRAPNQGL